MWAIIFVLAGIIFDFFDGFVARALGVSSPLGIQLDSLSDLVTSGVVPGLVMYHLIKMSLGHKGVLLLSSVWHKTDAVEILPNKLNVVALLGLLITLASAYRLARFNLDEDQQNYFKGLPVPANTLLIISLPLILMYQNNDFLSKFILNPWFLIGLTLLSSYLLNSNIKLFALKFKNFDLKNNLIRYIFLALCIFSLIFFKFLGIAIIIFIYITLSLLNQKHISKT